MKYMHYISLGYFCSIAIELERLGLRAESAPFDWLISDFKGVLLAMEEHFADWLEYDFLVQNRANRAYYMNTKYHVQFYHDFDKYTPLAKQLPMVQDKYNRRIQRFYQTISEPTLFIRYISDEEKVNGVSAELLWIEENYDSITSTLKSFHPQNEILFIANEGVASEKIKIYQVKKDENDVVSREPIRKDPALTALFQTFSVPEQETNLAIYQEKMKRTSQGHGYLSSLKNMLRKEYIHNREY